MNSSSGFVDSALDNGFYFCKYDRCGRKFDSETRLRDHQMRMHDKDISSQRSQVQAEMNLSNGSNMYKKDEQLKLPTISNGSQIMSTIQRQSTSSKAQDRSDQLHPVIRQAQQIANNGANIISNNSGNYSHQKKPSLTSSIVKNNTSIVGNSGSRPTSSSSSNFNTTSSSTNNVEFGIKENIMKNSYLNNSQVQQKATSNQIQLDQAINIEQPQSNSKSQLIIEKQQQINRINPNVIRKNNSQTSVQNTVKSSSIAIKEQQNLEGKIQNVQDKPKVKEQRTKTKEEILFGKQGLDRKRVLVQKSEKLADIKDQVVNQISNKDDGEDEDEILKEINKEDQILNMHFSDEENEEERLNEDEEDYDDMNEDEDQEYLYKNNVNSVQDQVKQRPSPSKDIKSNKQLQNEKLEKVQKDDQEKRRVSFANKGDDLEKEKENEEKRKQSEIDTKKFLSSKFLLEYTGYGKLEEVEQLILRNKNLLYLKDSEELDWSELMNLQFLCVAHNPLMEQIDSISSIPNHNLLELNLEYNSIVDISPIFHHTQLQKLYLNGNKIPSIKGINVLTQLKTLALMKNLIKGFDSTLDILCRLNKLEELELEQNPVSSRFNYKYDILWKLKLKKLDGEEVTDLDIELSKDFQKEYLNYTKEQQRPGQPVRPGTAKDWGSRSTFNDNGNSSKSYKDRFKQKINDLVQESKEVLNCIPEDKVSELETEIELARQQEEQLEAELEMLYYEQKELRENKEKLINQNEEFTQSVLEFQQLQQQKIQLTNKFRPYHEQLNNNKSEMGIFIKEIYRLNLQLENLQKENQDLAIENKILSQTQSKFFKASERPVSANKSMRQSKADFKKSLTIFNQLEQNIKQQQHQQQSQKYTSKIYDDAEEVESQGEEEEEIPSTKANDSIKHNIKQNIKQQQKQEEIKNKQIESDNQEEEENEDYNANDLDLDIGFDSDDLDEDMKEIREMLKKNENALKDVKSDLNDI